MEEFRDQFSSSIKRQIMSDVGYVSYLSGGIDSSAIVYELSKINKEISTFSIYFWTSSNVGPFSGRIFFNSSSASFIYLVLTVVFLRIIHCWIIVKIFVIVQ